MQQFQNVAEKAEGIKGQIKDDKDQHNFGVELTLFNSTFSKLPNAKPGALCNAYKKTLTSSQTRMQGYAQKSDLTLE